MHSTEPSVWSEADQRRALIAERRTRLNNLLSDPDASDEAIEDAAFLHGLAIDGLTALFIEQARKWRGVDAPA